MVPIDQVLERLQRVRKKGTGYLALCPAHADSSPSLSVTMGDRGILLHCFAGCEPSDIADALGVRMTDLFTEGPRGGEVIPFRPEPATLTLDQLAAAKRLPVDFLRALQCTTAENSRGTYVEIPYFTRAGDHVMTHNRSALSGPQRFWCARGAPRAPYMPDRGALQDAEGFAFIVEGESDVWTLLHAGYPAIGLPGVGHVECLEPEHVQGLARVFVVQEIGQGGEKFVAGVRARLEAFPFAGEVHTFKCPASAKDPSALWLRDQSSFAAAMAEEIVKVTAPPVPRWLLLADAIPDLLRPLGPRLTTGFPTLDACMRGGIPRARFIVISGAPGSAKTTLAVNLARTFENQSETILYLAADEPASGIAMRIGQMFGFHRDGLEEDSDIGVCTRAGFAAAMRGKRFVVLDPDPASLTLEAAAECLAEAKGGPGGILIVDSLQTVRCAAAEGFDKPRERMDAVVRSCKHIAQRGAVVIALSEMSRAGYAGQEKTSALGSSKESSAIEYGASLLLGLTRLAGSSPDFKIEVAKNRLGGERPDVYARLNFASAELTEITLADVAASADPIRPRKPGQVGVDQRIREVLQDALQPLSRNEICLAAGGQKSKALETIAAMVASGFLRELHGGLWLVTRPDPE